MFEDLQHGSLPSRVTRGSEAVADARQAAPTVNHASPSALRPSVVIAWGLRMLRCRSRVRPLQRNRGHDVPVATLSTSSFSMSPRSSRACVKGAWQTLRAASRRVLQEKRHRTHGLQSVDTGITRMKHRSYCGILRPAAFGRGYVKRGFAGHHSETRPLGWAQAAFSRMRQGVEDP